MSHASVTNNAPLDLSFSTDGQDDQLEEYEDLFTPEENAKLDTELLETWDDVKDLWENPAVMGLVLSHIVLYGGPQMNPAFSVPKNCKSLCESNLPLRQALIHAAKERSFSRIRRLAILRTSSNNQKHEAVSQSDIIGAWKQKFLGHCHQDLLNNINAMDREQLHSNTAPIIQSSGTGKSRTVDEQAKLVFTIPFNLRADKVDSEFTFPLPDCSIRDYFIHDIASQIGNRARVSMLHFWICLFDDVMAIVAKWPHTRHRTYTSLAIKWYKYLSVENNRKDLYAGVIQNARTAYQASLSTWHELATIAKRNLTSLIDTIDSHVEIVQVSGDIKVMMYFDEAYALADTTLVDVFWEDPDLKPKADNPASSSARPAMSLTRPWTLYDMVMWCFASFRPLPVFSLFLSTTSKFSLLAPTLNDVQSAGGESLGKVCLQPPIVEFPFDEYPNIGVQDGCITFSELKQVKYLAKFGRTIFWAYMDSIKSANDPRKVEQLLLRLAKTKLVQTPLPRIMYNMTARTALLDVRLMFGYQPNHERARKMQEDLVASHLRLAYSVPQHREYMRSGYSSEPLVAEAAAQIMHTVQQSYPSFMVNTLRQVMELGIIDLGERGEIIGRALLMKAYDDAVRIEQPDSNPPNFSAGCTVVKFIQSLFVSSVSTLILESIPSNCGDINFKEAFKNARMRFTHFGRLDDDTLLCPSGMFVAFVRGMAFICQVGEFSIDFVIPIAMLKDDDETISQHSMTTLFLQIKRRIKEGPTNAYQINEEKFDFFPRGKAGPQLFPYITLVMEVGVLPAGVVATSYKNPIGNDKFTAVPSKVSEGTASGKSNRKGKGKGEATPVLKDDRNVTTSRKRKMSQREVTPEASTSKMRRGENDASYPGIPHTPESKRSADGVITLTFPRTPSKVRVIQHGQLHHPPVAHPCYSIFAYGCSNTVYKVIRRDEREGYAALLANRNLLMEHPRQDAVSLTYVRRMKYRWNSHNDTCHWVYFTEGPLAK